MGIPAEQVGEWEKAGFDELGPAVEWYNAGFEVSEAVSWYNAGFTSAKAAAGWRATIQVFASFRRADSRNAIDVA